MKEIENHQAGLGIEHFGGCGSQLYRIRPHTSTHLVVARWKRHLTDDECDAVVTHVIPPNLVAVDDLVEYYPLAMSYED